MGPKSAFRSRLFRAVHVEAAKRGLDHDALHAMVERNYSHKSMSALTDQQLMEMYKGWTGKGLKRRVPLPAKGEAAKGDGLQMICGEDLVMLDQEFARRGIGVEGRRNFVRRQLRGREEIRTRQDLARVYNGVRAMNKRDGLI